MQGQTILKKDLEPTGSMDLVHSGMLHGLTCAVGSDEVTIVSLEQIILNLHQSFPKQRMVCISSNPNQFLASLHEHEVIPPVQMMAFETATTKDFDWSPRGRVNFALERRLHCLSEVGRLATFLKVDVHANQSCVAAAGFYALHVAPKLKDPAFLKGFFDSEEDPISRIKLLFQELSSYQALEYLRSDAQREDYVLLTLCRVLVLTPNQAVKFRSKLIQLGFHYHSLLIHGAHQVNEAQSLLSMLLQDTNRLHRIILAGKAPESSKPDAADIDFFHRQCNFDQSLLHRLLRLGVPRIDVDK